MPALLFAILAWVPSQSQAAPATLSQSDLALAVHASPDGTTWSALGASALAGFFEWDYAAIDGLGFGHSLHVGDSTWFAGIMFDL